MSRRFFALSAVTRRIDELLRPAYDRTFWVKAEISSGRERRGAFYCDLVETDAAGRVVAQLRCTLWERDLARIRRSFGEAGLDLVLDDGTVVGLLCRLRFHPRHGLSLSGLEMDPAVALGELELRRRRILEALERDGVLGRNALRPLSLLPNRIAVITSASSAACRDLLESLQAAPFGFRIWLADALVQGPEAERSVLRALDACGRLPVDLIAIVRGGGSRTDLAALDSEAVARRIAELHLPVWTGIGHETDTSVLDAVAARAFKTPTALAEGIVSRFVEVEQQLRTGARRLRSAWELRLGHEGDLLRRAGTGLRQGTRKLLEVRRAELLGAAQAVRARVSTRLGGALARVGAQGARLRARGDARLRDARGALGRGRERLRLGRVLGHIDAERARLRDRERLLRGADPATALARGFSLTYTSAGALVRSVDDVLPGRTIVTRLADGSLESEVRKLTEDPDA